MRTAATATNVIDCDAIVEIVIKMQCCLFFIINFAQTQNTNTHIDTPAQTQTKIKTHKNNILTIKLLSTYSIFNFSNIQIFNIQALLKRASQLEPTMRTQPSG